MKNTDKIIKIAKDIGYAFIVTQTDGLIGRPMRMAEITEEGKAYFYTVYETNKVDEMERNPDVLVLFADTSGQDYISAQGKASFSFDNDKIDEFWSVANNAFFTEGKKTKGLCLIEVSMTHVEAWDTTKNMLQIAWDISFSMRDGHQANLGEQISADFH